MSFNFSREQPPDEVISVLQKTNKLNEEQFNGLLDIVFSFLTNASSAKEVESRLEDYAASRGINATPLKNMSKIVIIVANAMVKKNLSVIQIESDLQKMYMKEVHVKIFCQKWKDCILKMQTSLLISSTRGKKLVDMDWKFGVTASSSEIQKVGSCFIQMKFTLEGEDRKLENVETEMTLPQFYDFMHEVERAKISLESLG